MTRARQTRQNGHYWLTFLHTVVTLATLWLSVAQINRDFIKHNKISWCIEPFLAQHIYLINLKIFYKILPVHYYFILFVNINIDMSQSKSVSGYSARIELRSVVLSWTINYVEFWWLSNKDKVSHTYIHIWFKKRPVKMISDKFMFELLKATSYYIQCIAFQNLKVQTTHQNSYQKFLSYLILIQYLNSA